MGDINFEFAYQKIPLNDGNRSKPEALAAWWDFWKEIHTEVKSYDEFQVEVSKAAGYYLHPPFDIGETGIIVRQAWKSIGIELPDTFPEDFLNSLSETVTQKIALSFKIK